MNYVSYILVITVSDKRWIGGDYCRTHNLLIVLENTKIMNEFKKMSAYIARFPDKNCSVFVYPIFRQLSWECQNCHICYKDIHVIRDDLNSRSINNCTILMWCVTTMFS